MPVYCERRGDERCLEWGHELAEPTFIPICTLPKGHAGPHNWLERMERRNRLRAEAGVNRVARARRAKLLALLIDQDANDADILVEKIENIYESQAGA